MKGLALRQEKAMLRRRKNVELGIKIQGNKNKISTVICRLTDVSNRVPSRRTHMSGSVVSLRGEGLGKNWMTGSPPLKDTAYINLKI